MTGSYTRIASFFALVITVVVSLFSVSGVSASALSFCPLGSAAGQCSSADTIGIATDFETGRVYVADESNRRIDVFEANGTFLFAFGWKVNAASPEEKLQTCTTVSGCQAGSSGSGAGQFHTEQLTSVAVDNVVGSGSRHDVYVGTDGFRVQKFSPAGDLLLVFGSQGKGECQLDRTNDGLAVGPEGNVFVADAARIGPSESEGFISRVEKFSPAGACLGETKLLGPTPTHPTQRVSAHGLAVDASENAYVTFEGTDIGPREFHLGSPESEVCKLQSEVETLALALDEGGHLFATQGERGTAGGTDHVVTEYNGCPPNNILHRFGYDQIGRTFGLAVFHSLTGDVFAGEGLTSNNHIHYLGIPAAGPIIVSSSVQAAPLRSVWAGIGADINPEGKATQYTVQYVDRHSYETEGGFTSPKTRSSGAVSLGAEDFSVHAAEMVAGCHPFTGQALSEGRCLVPDTAYRYRIVAQDSGGEAMVEGEMTTRPPIEFEGVYASEPASDAIVLNAKVDPLGSTATGYFQYVDDAGFEAGIRVAEEEGESRIEAEAQGRGFDHALESPGVGGGAAPLDFGAGEEGVKRSTVLSSLPPGVRYHYRLLLTDPFGMRASEAGVFTTFGTPVGESCAANEEFRTGLSAFLPDCRVYEMVSPVDKEGGDIAVLLENGGAPAVLEQSAASGERLAYGSYRSFGDAQSSPYTSQYIAARYEGEGWVSHGIVPPQGATIIGGLQLENEYHAFSPDLCEGWSVPLGEPPLAEGAVAGYYNLYRRSDQLCSKGSKERYEAISTAKPENYPPGGGLDLYKIELQGLSADGGVAAFLANDSLEGSGAPVQPAGCTTLTGGCRQEVYVRAVGGQPRFACVLPGGDASKTSCSAGTGDPGSSWNARRANVTGALSADGRRLFWTSSQGNSAGMIYLRENPLGEGSECASEGSPCTITVSKAAEEESGVKDDSQFWVAARDGSRAVFTTGSSGSAGLYEFSVAGEVTHKIAGEVWGMLGASTDASRVYFASSEVIAGSGTNSEGAAPVVSKPNLYVYDAVAGTYRFVGTLTAGDVDVGPVNGGTSATALWPVKHSSRVSADGSQVVFMSTARLTGYDNTDAVSGQADSEVFVYDASANGGTGQIVCVSCNPSGARPEGVNVGAGGPFWIAARLPGAQSTLYSPHVLSEDGKRLFFESQDPLVARDGNGRIDVYEWEREGTGGCGAGSPAFSPVADGCVDLVSSGQSKDDARFVDASPSGHDVFFATLSSLVPQDPGLVDIYDARVYGGFPTPAVPAVCEGEACQNPSVAPADLTPGSLAFSGSGNVLAGPTPPVAVVKPTVRKLTRAQLLSKALRVCRAKSRRKRTVCETAARRRYRAKNAHSRTSVKPMTTGRVGK